MRPNGVFPLAYQSEIRTSTSDKRLPPSTLASEPYDALSNDSRMTAGTLIGEKCVAGYR